MPTSSKKKPSIFFNYIIVAVISLILGSVLYLGLYVQFVSFSSLKIHFLRANGLIENDTSIARFSPFHTNYTTSKFTVVMPTYQRSKQLSQVLNHYCDIPNVDKILVLWNNVGQELPDEFKNFTCQVPVEFLIMKENRLTNRFVPYPEIQTEAIFAVDDDRMIDKDGMTLGFSAWRAFPRLIVGFCQRSHSYVYENGTYKYGAGIKYTMVLTNSVFLHRRYLHMFTYSLPRELYEFIDDNKNGEDIIMNAMVADYLRRIDRPQCPCVKVDGRHTKEVHLPPEKPGGYVSLYRRKNHYTIRSECMKLVEEVFGYMPLMYCQLTIKNSVKY